MYNIVYSLQLLDRVASNEKRSKILRICCRYLSTSRNTLIVLIAGIVSYIWIHKSGQVPYALSKSALATLPNFTVPSLNIVTPERSYSFWEVLKELNIGIIVIPIVGILTNISIGKLSEYKERKKEIYILFLPLFQLPRDWWIRIRSSSP